MKKARVFMGDLIIRKVCKAVNKGEAITVCLPWTKTEDVAEWIRKVIGYGTGRTVLVRVGKKNAEKEEMSATVGKYRSLIKIYKEARIGKIILAMKLPVM